MSAPARGPRAERVYADALTLSLPLGSVACVRRGAGPPVVLLHGVPLSLLTWRHNLESLAARFDVIALDLPGYGRSGPPADGCTVQAQARAVADALDVLGVARATVAGSSYGAAVALQLAVSAPERVERLVLLNPVTYPTAGHSMERLLRIGALSEVFRFLFRRTPLGRALLYVGLWRSYARPGRHPTGALAAEYAALLLAGEGDRAFLSTLRELREAELALLPAQVRCPTLILWGSRDRVLTVRNGHRMQREIAGARLEVLPHCGHLPHEEDPALVNSLIAEFAAQAEAAPAAADGYAILS